MLRVKARLERPVNWRRLGVLGGFREGILCNKGKGSRSGERREGWDIFGTQGKSQLANVFSR